MNTTNRNRIIVHIPPPLLFLTTFIAGIGLEIWLPLGIHLARFGRITYPLGIGLLACGLLLGMGAIATFLRNRTTVFPHGNPARLVTGGPYRLTRNPMYVSLTLAYLGAASLWQLLWPLALLPLPLLWLDRLLIPLEESRLQASFQDTYDAYRHRVRRWL